MKTYELIHRSFGHEFSFNAENIAEATELKNAYCDKHDFAHTTYSVKETENQKWIHSEYINPKFH